MYEIRARRLSPRYPSIHPNLYMRNSAGHAHPMHTHTHKHTHSTNVRSTCYESALAWLETKGKTANTDTCPALTPHTC